MAQTQTKDQPAWRVARKIEGDQAPTAADYQALLKRLSQVEEQLNRLRRFDKSAAEMREHQQLEGLLQDLLIASNQVNELLKERGSQEDPMETRKQEQHFHSQNRHSRQKEVQEHLAFALRLIRAQQVLTPACTCGQHHGITFVEGEDTLAENVCPKDWWFTQSRVALSEGKLSSFRAAYPIEDYLGAYRLPT